MDSKRSLRSDPDFADPRTDLSSVIVRALVLEDRVLLVLGHPRRDVGVEGLEDRVLQVQQHHPRLGGMEVRDGGPRVRKSEARLARSLHLGEGLQVDSCRGGRGELGVC